MIAMKRSFNVAFLTVVLTINGCMGVVPFNYPYSKVQAVATNKSKIYIRKFLDKRPLEPIYSFCCRFPVGRGRVNRTFSEGKFRALVKKALTSDFTSSGMYHFVSSPKEADIMMEVHLQFFGNMEFNPAPLILDQSGIFFDAIFILADVARTTLGGDTPRGIGRTQLQIFLEDRKGVKNRRAPGEPPISRSLETFKVLYSHDIIIW